MSGVEPPTINLTDVEFDAIRAQGAGGQNVNKTSSAIHLRFDIRRSSLSDEAKQQLLASRDQRINAAGVLVIKAQRYRSQEANREDALQRLALLLAAATTPPKARKATRPTRGSQLRRVASKVQRGRLKVTRSRIDD